MVTPLLRGCTSKSASSLQQQRDVNSRVELRLERGLWGSPVDERRLAEWIKGWLGSRRGFGQCGWLALQRKWRLDYSAMPRASACEAYPG